MTLFGDGLDLLPLGQLLSQNGSARSLLSERPGAIRYGRDMHLDVMEVRCHPCLGVERCGYTMISVQCLVFLKVCILVSMFSPLSNVVA